MAATVRRRDADGARKIRDDPGGQQVKHDCLRGWKYNTSTGSHADGKTVGKRRLSSQDENQDEDATEHRRKSRRIQEKCQFFGLRNIGLPQYHVTDHVAASKQFEQVPRSSTNTLRKSPRSQQKPAAALKRARGRQSEPLQRTVEQFSRPKEKDEGPTIPPADTGAQKSTKRRRCASIGDEPNHGAKRPTHRLAQHIETTSGLDKEDFIENWIGKSSWSRRASTESERLLPEASVDMPGKSAPVLPSPGNSTMSSRRSEKSAASVHDTDYRQSLSYRNIYINRNDPPAELIQRAKRIISRSRASPEMDAATAQALMARSRRVETESEDVIIQQLAPGIIPAMDKVPDSRFGLEHQSTVVQFCTYPTRPVYPDEPTSLTQTETRSGIWIF
ncbi:hypothetical protein LTR67_010784 [Exophiala xenobiotica]